MAKADIQRSRRVVIVGGGISGLSTAYYLQKNAAEQGVQVELTLLEQSERLGGKVNTLRQDGFVIERGPDSFLARKQAMIDLAEDLGLADQLTGTSPTARKTYVLQDRELVHMSGGFVLGVPIDLDLFAQSQLLSEEGKQRALEDLELPSAATDGDEALGHFLKRRLGSELVRRISEPLLAGIYAGDLDKLSLQATFPQFAAAEREHGSLIRGMQHHAAEAALAASKQRELQEQSGKPAATAFLTYRGGLQTVIEGMEQSLRDAGADLQLHASVKEIRMANSEAPSSSLRHTNVCNYEVHLSNGTHYQADQLVLAVPAYIAADLLAPHIEVRELRSIDYVSVANVVLGFNRSDFDVELDGSGFVVARDAGLHITACTWTSNKWKHTSPDDKVLLRCYVGRAGSEEVVSFSDEELAAVVANDLQAVMGLTAKPLFVEITRLQHSMPQYPVNHQKQMVQLQDRLSEHMPGVRVTGPYFEGVGLPDCVRLGKELAGQLMGNE